MSEMRITTRDFSPFGGMLARSLLNEALVAETRGAEALGHYLQYTKPRRTRDLQKKKKTQKRNRVRLYTLQAVAYGELFLRRYTRHGLTCVTILQPRCVPYALLSMKSTHRDRIHIGPIIATTTAFGNEATISRTERMR